MILRTRRLWIRTIDEADLNQIHELLSYPEVSEFNTMGTPKNILFTRRILTGWLEKLNHETNRNFTFKIDTKDTRDFVGLIAISTSKCRFRTGEVWYKLKPEEWGKGYATEALIKIIEFGFEDLQLHRIEASCAIGNIRSYKVMEKAGMIREGRKRKSLALKTGWSDSFDYGILHEDWREY